MKMFKHVIALPLLVIGNLAAAPADAESYYDAPGSQDVDSCIREVRARTDVDGATQVRHDIVRSKRRSVGYAVEIDTVVYATPGGAILREYESLCVVTGSDKPVRFHISQKG